MIKLISDYHGDNPATEYNRRLNIITQRPWDVGFQDRGLDRVDITIMARVNYHDIPFLACDSAALALHLCLTHNQAIGHQEEKPLWLTCLTTWTSPDPNDQDTEPPIVYAGHQYQIKRMQSDGSLYFYIANPDDPAEDLRLPARLFDLLINGERVNTDPWNS